MTYLQRRYLMSLGILAGVVLLCVRGVDAHKGITSKYTYNDDVFPILRDQCGRCHVEGGPAPMSLMSYDVQSGAVAWAESIRENLVAEAMPPWYVDPAGPAVRGGHTLSPRELDIVITWAAGGTPQGDLRKKPGPMAAHPSWTLGPPDVTLPFPKEHTLGPGQMEASIDLSIPTSFADTKWLRAIDVLPGTVSMVRSVTVGIEGGPVVSVWEPGGDIVPAPDGTGFKLPPGATLQAHVRYKKSYLEEQQSKSDRSTLGLYFTRPPVGSGGIDSFTVRPSGAPAGAQPDPRFSGEIAKAGRLLALRPSVDKAYAVMTIDAVPAGGRQRTTLLKLRGIRPEWPRRYWLANPVDLQAGTKVEVSATAADPDSGPLAAPVKAPLEIALDFAAR